MINDSKLRNRIHNSGNSYQENFKKVLCVCSAGLLRSPTAALVLSKPPYNFNTRACGIDTSYALIPIDDVLIYWAEEIVCMNNEQKEQIEKMCKKNELERKIINLHIDDSYSYRDDNLIKKIKTEYNKHWKKDDKIQ